MHINKIVFIAVNASLLVSSLCCQRNTIRDAPHAPSVLLITIDTLRADYLGCYGNEHVRTPYIDQLSRKGVLFSNVTCQAPATGPSCASFLTSKYPTECGVLHSTMKLKSKNVTFAEIMRKQKYRTAAFVSCSILDSKYGFSQGFSTFDDEFTCKYSEKEYERNAESTSQAALSWITSQKAAPFFVWLHLFDPHVPYKKHTPVDIPDIAGTLDFLLKLESENSANKLAFALPSIKKLYAEEIHYVDQHLGRVMNAMKVNNRDKKCVIILSSDHGEELFDHVFYHGHFLVLTQSVLHVPLIICMPSKLEKGKIFQGLAENVDILPTILSLLEFEERPGLRGINLLPSLAQPSLLDERHAFSMREPYEWIQSGEGFAIRNEEWKYLSFSKSPHILINLTNDPDERTNILEENQGISARLRTKLRDIVTISDTPEALINRQDIDEYSQKALKSLGYLD